MIDFLIAVYLLTISVAAFASTTQTIGDFQWSLYGIVFGVSIVCGFASYSANYKNDRRSFQVMVFIGEMTFSGLFGLAIWWVGEIYKMDMRLCFILSGSAGYFGCRFVYFLEKLVKGILERLAKEVFPKLVEKYLRVQINQKGNDHDQESP